MVEKYQPIDLSTSEVSSLKKKAIYEDHYRFFDTEAALKSDSREFLNFFRQMYKHFSVPPSEWRTDVYLYYILAQNMLNSKSIMLWNGTKVCTLPSGPDLYSAADTIIFSSAISKVRSHFLFHGAAVSKGRNSVIMSGLTGCGKTTLALELTRRGMKFLSDEMAPISRSDGVVDVFPRALGVREDTLKLIENIDLSLGRTFVSADGQKKCLINIDDLFENSISNPCRANVVLLLETSEGENGELGRDYHIVDIALRDIDTQFVYELKELDGVEYIFHQYEGEKNIVRIRITKKWEVQEAFNKICDKYEDSILYRVMAVEQPPRKQQDPRIIPLPKMKAGMELMANLQNLNMVNRGIGEEKSSDTVSGMLFELTDAIADAQCYRLLVGNLRKTAHLVSDLIH